MKHSIQLLTRQRPKKLKKITLYSLALLSVLLSGCEKSWINDIVPSALTVNSEYTENIHYKVISVPHPEEKSVVEFFWYGCSHCKDFQEIVKKWKETKEAEVSFRYVPAMWHDAMVIHSKAFYIGQKLPQAEEIHAKLFDFVMELANEESLEDHERKLALFFTAYGLDSEDFFKQYGSSELGHQLNKDHQLLKDSEMSGTPSFLVDGKFLVINNSVKNRQEVMHIVDYLLAKNREQEAALSAVK